MRKVASCILKILDSSSGDIHLDHLHSFILDVIEKLYASKTGTIKKRSLPKYTLPINFNSKSVELIKILQVLIKTLM